MPAYPAGATEEAAPTAEEAAPEPQQHHWHSESWQTEQTHPWHSEIWQTEETAHQPTEHQRQPWPGARTGRLICIDSHNNFDKIFLIIFRMSTLKCRMHAKCRRMVSYVSLSLSGGARCMTCARTYVLRMEIIFRHPASRDPIYKASK